MLRRYQVLCNSFRPLKTPLFSNPSKKFSFIRLTENMEVRKKIRFDIGEANHKFKQKNKRFYERIQDTLKNNKKKIAFFITLCALLNFYQGYKSFVKLTRKLDAVKLRLKIWFLGEKHYIPDSIEETFMTGEGIKLKPETVNTLSELFVETDRELKYGINRKFLIKLYSKLNVVKSKEERIEFYNDTVYSKKQNQKLNGVSLKQFLLIFQSMLKKARKEESGLTEQEFARRLTEIWAEITSDAMVWQAELYKKRVDPSKLLEGPIEKQKLIKNIIIENPMISLEDVEKRARERGLKPLTIREKIQALEDQVVHLSNLKVSSGLRSYSALFDPNTNLEKSKEIEKKIKEINEALADLKLDFQRTLDKSVKHGYIS